MNIQTIASRTLAPLALAAVLALPAGQASAVTLALGSNALTGTTSALEPQLAGLIVEDELTDVSFAIGSGTFSATIQSRVVLSDDGTYDFYWRIRDTEYSGTEPAAIGSFRIGDFGISTEGLNGNFRVDGLGDIGPDEAFVFGGAFSEFVNFNFDGGMRAGNESLFMFLDTDATHYAKTAFFDLTNVGQTQISGSFATFGVGVVPEPATWAMMIAGFGLAGAALRTRRRLRLA